MYEIIRYGTASEKKGVFRKGYARLVESNVIHVACVIQEFHYKADFYSFSKFKTQMFKILYM